MTLPKLLLLFFSLYFCVGEISAQDNSNIKTREQLIFERERENYQELRSQESDIMISRRYRRGPHLIYDCKDQHFACVSLESRGKCEEDREEALEKRQVELSCAPLRTFDNADLCEATQEDVMLRLVDKEFCWNLSPRALFEY